MLAESEPQAGRQAFDAIVSCVLQPAEPVKTVKQIQYRREYKPRGLALEILELLAQRDTPMTVGEIGQVLGYAGRDITTAIKPAHRNGLVLRTGKRGVMRFSLA